MYKTRYEKELIQATKEFAQCNNIPFSKMTEMMLINTIRQVRKDVTDGRIVNKKNERRCRVFGEINYL